MGPMSCPKQKVPLYIPEHKSVAIRICEGNFDSHLFSIIGNIGISIDTTVTPVKNNPAATIKTLFGKNMAGPTKKFDRPHSKIDILTNVTRFMQLEMYGTTNDITQ